MAEKYFFHVQPSLATGEMQIKTTLGFHLTPVNVVKKKTSNDKSWHGCGEGKHLVVVGGSTM